jgi:hypothetical protein
VVVSAGAFLMLRLVIDAALQKRYNLVAAPAYAVAGPQSGMGRMPTNPWLALDAAAVPASLARDLRQAWELFLVDGELTAVRAPIAASWQRSQAAGVDPLVARVAPVVADIDEVAARWEVHPLSNAASLIR